MSPTLRRGCEEKGIGGAIVGAVAGSAMGPAGALLGAADAVTGDNVDDKTGKRIS